MAIQIIKTCWFDLGNVILPFNFTPAFKTLGHMAKTQPKHIEQYFINRPHFEADLDEGRLHAYQLYRMLKKEFKITDLRYAEFKTIWNDIFKEDILVSKTLKQLKSLGIKLILISNTNKLHFEHIHETYPILSQFDDFILSYKLKTRKPNRDIYESALKISKAHPHQIFYTDDRADLISAAKKNHGVHAHTFTTATKLRRALKSKGVNL